MTKSKLKALLRNLDNDPILFMFVFNALDKLSRDTVEHPEVLRAQMAENHSDQFINPDAWIDAAQRIVDAINADQPTHESKTQE